MTDFLRVIGRERLERVRRDAAQGPPTSALRDEAEARRPERRDFAASIRRPEGSPIRVIAEVKEASPSAGTLRVGYDPAGLAGEYEAAGAAAISVLTEPSRFHGSVEHLAHVRERVGIPVLLKDFVVDERQLFEAGANGADAALLIVSLLEPARLRDYAAIAVALGMTPLVEVHEVDEIERAVAIEEAVLGVNNRDLRTLAMRAGHAESLLPRLPTERVRIGESGYRDRAAVRALARAGADGILVGESLLRASSVSEGFAVLFGAGGAGGEDAEGKTGG